MTREEIIRVLDEQDAAFNRRDLDGVAAMYSEDVRFVDQAVGEPVQGRDAVREFISGYVNAMPDFKWERVGIEVDGNVGVEQWRASGTQDRDLPGIPATHKRMTVEGCSVMHFGDDGLVHQEENYWDEAAMLRQLGVMPQPAAAG